MTNCSQAAGILSFSSSSSSSKTREKIDDEDNNEDEVEANVAKVLCE